MQRNLGVDLR